MQGTRFGLIGYGSWGRCHARAILETPGCELVAVCARTRESREIAAAETGAAVCGDYLEVIENPALDIIDIVLPNHLHEAVACAALKNGKHVLLEKPMSTGVESCTRILRAAREAGRILLVGHEMRFSPVWDRVRALVEAGELGDVRSVLIDLWRRPYRPGADGWRSDPARVGNWTLEEPVHYFDLGAWFLREAGAPHTVYAYGNQRDISAEYRADMNDNFAALVSLPDRSYMSISQSLMAVEHHLSVKVMGSSAMVRAEWHAELDRSDRPAYSLQISKNGVLHDLPVASTPGELFELRTEIAAMAEAVRLGRPLAISPEEALRAVALCEAAKASLTTGEPVDLRDWIPVAGQGR